MSLQISHRAALTIQERKKNLDEQLTHQKGVVPLVIPPDYCAAERYNRDYCASPRSGGGSLSPRGGSPDKGLGLANHNALASSNLKNRAQAEYGVNPFDAHAKKRRDNIYSNKLEFEKSVTQLDLLKVKPKDKRIVDQVFKTHFKSLVTRGGGGTRGGKTLEK